MKYSSIIIGLLVSSLIVSCSQESKYVKKTIYLAAYEKLEYDTSRRYLELTAVRVYPAQMTCISGRENYANLYIAKLKGQDLYIFECCRKVDEFAYDTTGRYSPMIDTNDISKNRQDSVIVFVPETFSVPAGAKYVLASLGFQPER